MERIEVKICLGSSCFARGNSQLIHQVREYLRQEHLENQVNFKGARCFNACKSGPVMQVNTELVYGIQENNVIELLKAELNKHGVRTK